MKILMPLTIAVIAGLSSSPASAGWFGPSNYEECVLEKMKGQLPYMLTTAQNACRLKFMPEPPQTKEVSLDKRLIQFNWCADEPTEKQLCIVDKPNNYEITSVELYLSDCTSASSVATAPDASGYVASYLPTACDYIGPVTISGEKSHFSATYTFKIPPGNYPYKWVGFGGFIK